VSSVKFFNLERFILENGQHPEIIEATEKSVNNIIRKIIFGFII
jgi:hypothetical protein